MAAGHPVQVRLSDDERNALDSYRRRKLNPPSRAQALRELANTGLQVSEALHHSITANDREVDTCSSATAPSGRLPASRSAAEVA